MSPAPSPGRTVPEVDEAEAVELLSRLVSIPSVNPAFRRPGDPEEWFNEAKLGAFVADWLRALAIETEVEFVEPERPNVIARVRGTEGGPSMIWEGHLDTVQVTGLQSPFLPRLVAGELHGRGAVDDKGCLAAFMLALRDLQRSPPPGDVTFLAAMDEEYRFSGIAHHLKRGERYDLGIAGEPTTLRLVRACKGCLRWHVDVVGRSAHTARAQDGVDALIAARKLLDLFEGAVAAQPMRHPLLGGATLVCTALEAGDGPNTVPGQARLRFDYRYLPGENGRGVWDRFRDLARDFGASAGVEVTVHEPFMDGSAMDVPPDAAAIRLLAPLCRNRGLDPEPVGVPFGSDATKMTDAGTPTVIFGPGSIEQAHADDEFVDISQIVEAANILVEAARRVNDVRLSTPIHR